MAKEKSLEKRESNLSIPVSPAFDPEWEDPADDFLGPKIPILKAVQSGTEDAPDGSTEGVFFNTVTGQVYENPTALLLYVARPRMALYKPYTPGVKKPLTCSSSNGIHPDGGDAPLPGPCRKKVGGRWVDACPKCTWDGDKPPECSTLYTALLWIMGKEDTVMHTFKRTSVKALRGVLSKRRQMTEALMDKENPDIHPKFLVPVKLYTERKANYFEVKMELLTDEGHRVPADYARGVMGLTKGFVDQLNQMTTDEITETNVSSEDPEVSSDVPY